MNTWVDFKAIKSQITMEMALGHYGIKLRQASKEYLRGPCPLPSHSSDKSKESFTVNVAKNVWACPSTSCVSARGGRKGGNVLDFVSMMEGNLSVREAGLKLQEWFPTAGPIGDEKAKTESELVRGKKETPQAEQGREAENNSPLSFTLKGINSDHPYLAERDIGKETAEYFGVGFFPGKGSMAGRVVIPIYNEKGELVAYAGRSIDGSEPKYKLPAGFKKALVLFNLHRAMATDKSRGVVVTEGYFDAMKVHQSGWPCVVALMGSSLSEAQEKLIVENFQMVALMLDGDEAGRSASRTIAERLVQKLFTRVVLVPTGSQPDQLSLEQIRKLHSI